MYIASTQSTIRLKLYLHNGAAQEENGLSFGIELSLLFSELINDTGGAICCKSGQVRTH